ncbi:50S ribosomal protein L18 [Candidatus Bathyarchaeota archaeon]|nr:50S ribosomal protein L18 [Candidatus Bathyarchaeota archaeon]
MAKGAHYRVSYRRRMEHKTDYQARRILATSEAPRFVVRVSNKNLVVQLVKSEIAGDLIITQAASKELIERYHWQASSTNIPAAYLVGLIAGHKAIKEGVDNANLDLGLKRPTKGSKIFAVVKGAIDAGLKIPCDSDVIPPPERISGGDIAKYAEVIGDPFDYERLFSVYLKRGLRPEALPTHFEETKSKIMEDWAK